jgi:4-methyl-5(b-hydroxyethyl)-thiazole monophosphate biosynthesis
MKTMVLFYPGCIEFEVMLAAEILNRKYPIEIKTTDGKDHVGSNGMLFKSSGAIDSIDVQSYKVALIPGGDPGVLIENSALNGKLKKLYSHGAILGAICAGPVLLERAGLLKKRRIAHGYKGPQLKFLNENGFFKDTILTDEAVIAENRIVTARPDSFIDFAVAIARMAEVIPEDRVDFWRSYYRGNRAVDEQNY